MNEYNFIGVTERFDESLVCLRIFRVSVNTMTRTILDIRSHAKVALKWLLNLAYHDVLHVSAKVYVHCNIWSLHARLCSFFDGCCHQRPGHRDSRGVVVQPHKTKETETNAGTALLLHGFFHRLWLMRLLLWMTYAPEILKYIENRFDHRNRRDFILYKAVSCLSSSTSIPLPFYGPVKVFDFMSQPQVNQQLDKLISVIPDFDTKLQKFRAVQEFAHTRCDVEKLSTCRDCL